MPELQLYPLHPLGGRAPLRETLPGLEIAEVGGRDLVSLAARRGAENRLRDAVRAAFGVDLPGPGRMTMGPRAGFVWMGQEQWFVDGPSGSGGEFEAALAMAVGGHASVTDQSDAWVRLRLSGRKVLATLEKLCMLDLSDGRFPPGSAARTVIEHLGTVVLHPDTDTFELWSARSSARSFLQAIRTAAAGLAAAKA